jgi:hypothetical protein
VDIVHCPQAFYSNENGLFTFIEVTVSVCQSETGPVCKPLTEENEKSLPKKDCSATPQNFPKTRYK